MAIDAKLPTLCVNKYLGDQFVFNVTCLDIGFKFNFLVSAWILLASIMWVVFPKLESHSFM